MTVPFPAATVIPPTWATHHAGVAAGSMLATIRVDRSDDDPRNDRQGFDPKRVRTPGAPRAAASDATAIWTGPAHVYAQDSQAATADVADERITVRTFAVSMPLAAPLLRAGDDGVGDRITVLASPQDPALVGARLRVIDVAVASESFARDVIALDDLTVNNPPPVHAPPPTP